METTATAQAPTHEPSRPFTMTLRVSADERKRIRDNARAEGLTVSDYLRCTGLAKREHDLDAVAKLLRDMIELHTLQGQVQQREVLDAVATGYRLVQDLILADQPGQVPAVPTRAN